MLSNKLCAQTESACYLSKLFQSQQADMQSYKHCVIHIAGDISSHSTAKSACIYLYISKSFCRFESKSLSWNQKKLERAIIGLSLLSTELWKYLCFYAWFDKRFSIEHVSWKDNLLWPTLLLSQWRITLRKRENFNFILWLTLLT